MFSPRNALLLIWSSFFQRTKSDREVLPKPVVTTSERRTTFGKARLLVGRGRRVPPAGWVRREVPKSRGASRIKFSDGRSLSGRQRLGDQPVKRPRWPTSGRS